MIRSRYIGSALILAYIKDGMYPMFPKPGGRGGGSEYEDTYQHRNHSSVQ